MGMTVEKRVTAVRKSRRPTTALCAGLNRILEEVGSMEDPNSKYQYFCTLVTFKTYFQQSTMELSWPATTFSNSDGCWWKSVSGPMTNLCIHKFAASKKLTTPTEPTENLPVLELNVEMELSDWKRETWHNQMLILLEAFLPPRNHDSLMKHAKSNLQLWTSLAGWWGSSLLTRLASPESFIRIQTCNG